MSQAYKRSDAFSLSPSHQIILVKTITIKKCLLCCFSLGRLYIGGNELKELVCMAGASHKGMLCSC